MIKDNQKMLNRFHVLIDAFLIMASFAISYYIRFKSPLINFSFYALERAYAPPLKIYSRFLIYIVPVYLIIYAACRLYNPKRSKTKDYEVFNIFKANAIGILYFTFLLYMQKESHLSRIFLGTFFVVNVLLSILFRLILFCSLKVLREKGINVKHIIIVGYSRAGQAYIDRILANPQWGYYIHGILDDNEERGSTYKGIKVLGAIDNLLEILPENKLDEITIALSIAEYSKLERIVDICEKSGVHTKFIPDYNNIIPTKPYIEDLNGLPIINIRKVPLSNTFNKIVKRGFDIIGSLIAITVFSIPMAIVSAIIKTTSKGPLIFSQVRIGLHNKEFKMYKFRSMEVQSEAKEKKAWTTINDPRITPIGKIIRKTSIDELPQFFNVLRGEMSLIGPRPERPYFVDKFKEEIPRYMIKHQVRPGITGWAQVNGYRGDTSIRKRIDCDLYYIENWTLWLDIKILFMTIFKGFVNKNAY